MIVTIVNISTTTIGGIGDGGIGTRGMIMVIGGIRARAVVRCSAPNDTLPVLYRRRECRHSQPLR